MEQASGLGNGLPVTNSVGRGPYRAQSRRLVPGSPRRGRPALPVDYATLLSRPAEKVVATLDCTTGWFSTQTWQGVPLMSLLETAGVRPGAGLRRRTRVSGYFGDFTVAEAK